MYLNTYNYFKYFSYNKMVKSNKPLIIKSVKSAMHSLLTPLVLTIFKYIFHCFIELVAVSAAAHLTSVVIYVVCFWLWV